MGCSHCTDKSQLAPLSYKTAQLVYCLLCSLSWVEVMVLARVWCPSFALPCLCVYFLVSLIALSRSLVCRLFRLISLHSGELYQMVAVAFCLTVAWISEHLGLSIELGAFVAGVMISATPYAEQTLHHIEPIRNVFAALFLASIGMIMNPLFLWVHLDVLLATLLVVIVFKCSLITLVVRAFGYSTRTSFTVGISMAQVGEFSFVLLSRASNLGLVQRKLYLLLLGTTALSLVATPIMFRATPYLLRFAFLAKWIKREEEDCVELQGRAPPPLLIKSS